VQYYFPTKDNMLGAAFAEVVNRIRGRMQAIELGADVRANLRALLRELLPVDARRAAETRVWLAFTARAAISPALAEIQRTVLTEIIDALTEGFTAALGELADPARCRRAAQVTVAAADGLALHAVSSGTRPTRRLAEPLEDLLDALLVESPRHGHS
jgi:AcrR family transcriptional regulator